MTTTFTVPTYIDYDTEIAAMREVRESVLDRFAGSEGEGLRRMNEILARIDRLVGAGVVTSVSTRIVRRQPG